jgi:hypothetical protein
MNYYKAYQQATLPRLVFELVATSIEQLQALGLDSDPYVVEETRLLDPLDPNYISYEFGICHVRIYQDILQARIQSEIDDAQAEFLKSTQVELTKKNVDAFKTSTFTYDGNTFPMNQGALTAYEAIFASLTTDMDLVALEGTYTLSAANIGSFKAAYYAKVIQIYGSNVSAA